MFRTFRNELVSSSAKSKLHVWGFIVIIILEKMHNKLSIIRYLNKESLSKLNQKESPGLERKDIEFGCFHIEVIFC